MFKYFIYDISGLNCGGGKADSLDEIYNKLLNKETAFVYIDNNLIANITKIV